MDDKQRYEVFKVRQGRCHYCGIRLKWENYEIKGLSGGWTIEEKEGEAPQALCYKCFEFPQRGKTAHRLTINEEQRTTAVAMGQDEAEVDCVEEIPNSET